VPFRQQFTLALLASAPLVVGCKATHADPPAPQPNAPITVASLVSQPDLPAEKRALLLAKDKEPVEKIVDGAQAVSAGLSLVDLRDEWTPYIFNEATAPDGTVLSNRYRSIFLGLASDATDADGQPLEPGVHNYLELYGIPPTLTVLRARFLEDSPDKKRCDAVDFAKIKAVTQIPNREPKAEARERARLAHIARDLEVRRKKAKLATLEDLAAADPKVALDVQALRNSDAVHAALPEVEKRLQCEGMFSPKVKHQRGAVDEGMRQALLRFQRKNKLYEGASSFQKKTTAALGRTPLENDYDALVRALTERAVSAADVLEDGSIDGKNGPPTYENAAGQQVPIRNLAQEATQAVIDQLGLGTPDAALAFFQRHPAADFQWLRAAVKMPPPPEYYSPQMDLSVEIDRGDVIYDPPFDENGKASTLFRKHFPSLIVRTKYRGKNISLVRWRTTIGGWRSDLASNGYEYYRYKGSDVGPRVWRNIVSGPVWIAPNSTPIRTLVKPKVVHGANQLVVNYDEVGPGYLSAYGLVAAYNVVPGRDGKPDWDNGVRVHGSSEYRSIYNPDGYSHGCHRLVNHLAVRLFSWVLQHRNITVEGDQPLGFSRQFLWKDDVFEMRLPTRGYKFVLDPPLPINVLEGNILGDEKKPIKAYRPKPGVVYPPGPMPFPPDSPEARAGGGDAD
jgi:hypothetical protein